MKDKFKMSFGMGIPSIIVIFITLTITTLASLALTSANSNYKLAKKSAEYITSYYSAQSKAMDEIAKVNSEISLGLYNKPSCTIKVPINDNQTLNVELLIDKNTYSIGNQCIEITNIWNYDDYKTNYSDIKIDK